MKVLPVTFKNNQNNYINKNNNEVFSQIKRINTLQTASQPNFTGLFSWLNPRKNSNLLTKSQACKLLESAGFSKDVYAKLMLLMAKDVKHILGRYNKDVLEKSIFLRQNGVNLGLIVGNTLTQDGFFNFIKRIEPVLNSGYPKSYFGKYIESDIKPDDAEKLVKLKKIAQEKRQQLSYSNAIIDDKEIDELFFDTPENVIKYLKILGQKDFVHSFAQKYDNLDANIRTTAGIDESLPEFQILLKLTNPTESDEYLKNQAKIKTLKKSFLPNNKDLIKQINTLTFKNRKMLENSLNNWEDKVDLINIYAVLQNNDTDFLKKVFELLKVKDKYNNRKLEKMLNIFITTDENWNKQNNLNFIGNKYIKKFFSANAEVWDNFAIIKDVLNKSKFKNPIDAFNELTMNKETHKQFHKLGVNYKNWVRFNPHSNIQKTLMIGGEKQKQNLIKSVESDLNDEILNEIPKEEISYLRQILSEKGYTMQETSRQVMRDGKVVSQIRTKHLFKGEKPIEFEDVPKVLRTINKTLGKREFWKEANPDVDINEAKEIFKAHLAKRLQDVSSINPNETAKPVSITVQKADMNNVEHSLFLGNHSGCCTAVGTGCNDWSAPTYVLSKMISAIEVKAGDDFVGNTMCYIAEIDGKPALILDNIELKNKYQYDDDIRDMIFNYARKITEDIGKPDMKIYACANRHKVDMSEFPLEDKEFRIIGNTGNMELYLDFDTSAHLINGKEIFESKLYKIY